MRTARLLLIAGAAALAGIAAAATGQTPAPATPAAPSAPADPALIARGHYLADMGDCVTCHTQPGGAPFAGGRALQTPFGTLLSANITSDHDTGIGDWTPDQFYRALHTGIDDEGKHLYPAFPYNYFTKVTRADSDAIFAYLQSVPAVHNDPNRNQLPFPLNIRGLMAVWNWLFFKPGEYVPNPAKSAAWNRGAYLVEGLGHCGACHTPANLLGAPQAKPHLHGSVFGQWFAADLTPNRRTGLGGWTRAELVEYLKTGGNAHAAASENMGEVVEYSLSKATDADLGAIATYLADLPPSPTPAPPNLDPAQMRQGQAIFVDNCSACHRLNGEGVPRFFPPLQDNANLQQSNPMTTVHYILTGVRSTPTAARPTGLGMPAYAWKLDDQQIAAVATYARNAWGNSARAVAASEVASLRRKLVAAGSQTARPEAAGGLNHPGPETLAPAGTDSRDNGTPNAGRIVGGGAGSGGALAGGSPAQGPG